MKSTSFLELSALLKCSCDAGELAQYIDALPTTDVFWDGLYQCAIDNFVLSELCAIIDEDSKTTDQLPLLVRKKIKQGHNYFKGHAIRQSMQIAQIDNNLVSEKHGHLLLIKGACSRFNTLYPNVTRRTMSDIDCLFYQPEILEVFRKLGYRAKEEGSLDLSNPDPILFERGNGLPRHLPGIVSDFHPSTVELHLCAVRFEFAKYLPDDFETDIQLVPNMANTFVPSEVNQFILLVLHSSLTDRMLHLGGLKLRSLHEGFLRFNTLSSDQRQYIADHFKNVGLGYELKRWLFICGKTFNDDAIMGKPTLRLRLSYLLFSRLNHLKWYISARYMFFLMVRGIKYGITQPQLRNKITHLDWWKHKYRLMARAWRKDK